MASSSAPFPRRCYFTFNKGRRETEVVEKAKSLCLWADTLTINKLIGLALQSQLSLKQTNLPAMKIIDSFKALRPP